jgi:uncharacterized protein YcbX
MTPVPPGEPPMRVARLGLTVLKGTRHQALDEVVLSAQGPVGDRLFCLVDPGTGQVLKTVSHGALLGATTTWRDDVLTVELDGRVLRGPALPTGEALEASYWGRLIRVEVVAGPWASAFSALLGRPVLLARAAAGDVVYGAPVSVVTTASLAALQVARRGPAGPAARLDLTRDSARFRATVVVDTGGTVQDRPTAEHAWVGRELVLGQARVRLTAAIVRCAVVDLHPVTGERDLRLLDALPRDAAGEPVLGLEGEVVGAGTVRHGDTVLLAGR